MPKVSADNMSGTVVDKGVVATKSWYSEIGDYDFDNTESDNNVLFQKSFTILMCL